jgi:hypothetical protein
MFEQRFGECPMRRFYAWGFRLEAVITRPARWVGHDVCRGRPGIRGALREDGRLRGLSCVELYSCEYLNINAVE